MTRPWIESVAVRVPARLCSFPNNKWHSSFPNLNPVTYYVKGVVEAEINYRSSNIDSLKLTNVKVITKRNKWIERAITFDVVLVTLRFYNSFFYFLLRFKSWTWITIIFKKLLIFLLNFILSLYYNLYSVTLRTLQILCARSHRISV